MVHQEQLPSPSTHAPKPTERAPSDMGTPAQPYLPPILLQYTQQPTLPAGVLPLNKNLTHANETTISSVGHNLEAGHEAGANQKQLKENVGATAQTSAMVPVLSLLSIVFLLTGVLLFVLCKRRKQSLQRSPGKLGLWTPPPGTSRNPDPGSSHVAGKLPQADKYEDCLHHAPQVIREELARLQNREGSHHWVRDQCLAFKARQCLEQHQEEGSWSKLVGGGSHPLNQKIFTEHLLYTRLYG